MSAVAAIVAYALHEAVRRRVFLVVLVLTIAFLSLFCLGTRKIFHETGFVAPPP